MATPRARSLATWLGLMPLAALVAVTAWQPWLGFGLIIGVVGGALTLVALMRTLEWLDDRDRLPAAPLAVGAVMLSWPPRARACSISRARPIVGARPVRCNPTSSRVK